MTPAKLDRERATLVVIDVQEAFRKAVPSFDDVARGAAALVRGADAVDLPVLVTEQEFRRAEAGDIAGWHAQHAAGGPEQTRHCRL